MDTFSHVPPGFRFHPTDEELVDYYLRKKVNGRRIDLDVIKEVDLYKIEPWDLQGNEEQSDWYFFSHKDKKYPTGTRTNRATASGFWKATGRDKSIYSKNELIGMRKTLVFYKGRAPNGQKSDWIMHEYRLETDENGTSQEEGWVVCRAFKKKIATMRSRLNGHDSPIWYNDDQVSFMQDSFMESSDQHGPSVRMTHTDSFMESLDQHGPCVRMIHTDPFMESTDQHQPSIYNNYPNYPCKKEHDNLQYQIQQDHFLQLPLLQSPSIPNINSSLNREFDTNVDETRLQSMHQSQDQSHLLYMNNNNNNNNQNMVDDQHVTDWRVLDKFVASQLSQEEMCKENEYISNQAHNFHNSDDSHMMMNNNFENQENC